MRRQSKSKNIMTTSIQIGNIYNGIKAGRFVVLAFREIDGEEYVQVKEVGPNGELGRGEMALPISALVA